MSSSSTTSPAKRKASTDSSDLTALMVELATAEAKVAELKHKIAKAKQSDDSLYAALASSVCLNTEGTAFSYCIIPTTDMKKSISWYKQVFGFSPRTNEEMDGWTVFNTGQTGLALHVADEETKLTQPTPSFFIADAEEFHAKAVAAGAEVIQPFKAQDWGGSQAEYKDCHGFPFTVVEVKPPAKKQKSAKD